MTMTDSASMETDPVRETNQLFRVLSHHYRRAILRVLQQSQNVTISDLAERVIQRTLDSPNEDSSSEEIATLTVELYHCHIPMLAEAELVDYAEERNSVTISDQATVEACLDALDDSE